MLQEGSAATQLTLLNFDLVAGRFVNPQDRAGAMCATEHANSFCPGFLNRCHSGHVTDPTRGQGRHRRVWSGALPSSCSCANMRSAFAVAAHPSCCLEPLTPSPTTRRSVLTEDGDAAINHCVRPLPGVLDLGWWAQKQCNQPTQKGQKGKSWSVNFLPAPERITIEPSFPLFSVLLETHCGLWGFERRKSERRRGRMILLQNRRPKNADQDSGVLLLALQSLRPRSSGQQPLCRT